MTPPARPTDSPSLYELMQAIRAELISRMDNHGRKLDEAMRENLALRERITRIEIERESEEENREQDRSTDRRISAVIGTSAGVIVQIAKAAWNFYHPSAG